MNWLDIVIILLLVYSVWEGWRQGVVTQILGLAALALGIFLALRYGGEMGRWFGFEDVTARLFGFVIVLAVVVAAVVLVGRLTRGLFRVAGLGMFDSLLGVLFSALKMTLFAGLLLMLFEMYDPDGKVLSAGVRNDSVMLRAIDGICDVVFPFAREMFKQL